MLLLLLTITALAKCGNANSYPTPPAADEGDSYVVPPQPALQPPAPTLTQARPAPPPARPSLIPPRPASLPPAPSLTQPRPAPPPPAPSVIPPKPAPLPPAPSLTPPRPAPQLPEPAGLSYADEPQLPPEPLPSIAVPAPPPPPPQRRPTPLKPSARRLPYVASYVQPPESSEEYQEPARSYVVVPSPKYVSPPSRSSSGGALTKGSSSGSALSKGSSCGSALSNGCSENEVVEPTDTAGDGYDVPVLQKKRMLHAHKKKFLKSRFYKKRFFKTRAMKARAKVLKRAKKSRRFVHRVIRKEKSVH